MKKLVYALLAAGLVLAATATDALAGGPVQAPEINPASVSGGLALLAGGILVARARWRK